jgi:tRNA pseudouridine55 synthase
MIHGLLVINKPENMGSHRVVEKVRELYKVHKVGHFGTLDPLAKGVLLIGLGNATKFFNFYIKKKKQYSGKIRFGFSTTTYDREGDPQTEKIPVNLNKVNIERILSTFTGKILQTPPIFSAKKFKGKPLYKYARQKQEVELKPVPIEIFQLSGEVLDRETLGFKALTSSGTYIRSLAHDIGKAVGVGAYLLELTRECIGEFCLKDSFSLDEITLRVRDNSATSLIIPIEALLPEFPKIIVSHGGRKGVMNGMPLSPNDIVKIISGDNHIHFFRLFDDEGKLLAIARKNNEKQNFKPFIVFPE